MQSHKKEVMGATSIHPETMHLRFPESTLSLFQLSASMEKLFALLQIYALRALVLKD